ncbi:MAG: hypothetical protein JWL65_2240 [Gammaproteobacteria bacterium]|nr:hypothetical protein [Gammaproteobacteria bacterium]
MFQFAVKLFKSAAADALRGMGTTALAVSVGLSVWAVSQVEVFRIGGVRAALANWDYGLLWVVVAWLAVLAFCARKRFHSLLREHHRVFRLVALNQDQVSDPDRISIWCALEFCRDLGPVDLVVRVTTLLTSAPATRVVHTERVERVAKNEIKRLALGSLRVANPHRPAYHSIWGSEPGTEDLKRGQVSILSDSKHIIDISVSRQNYRCYIEFVTAPPGALSAAMYMTDEDRSSWILKLPEIG